MATIRSLGIRGSITKYSAPSCDFQDFLVLLVLFLLLLSPTHSFDLVTNGGISIILRFERAPFITQEHTLWLPWDRFFVMETIVMRHEENEIPSCDLSNFARPNPVVSPSPLTSFASSCAEKGPIVPEIQVPRLLDDIRLSFYFSWGQKIISQTIEREKVSVRVWTRPKSPCCQIP